jgi:hypothetical protein
MGSIPIITQMRVDFTPNVRVDDDTLGLYQNMVSQGNKGYGCNKT